MYLFVDVLKLQLGEIISLELATLFILAIIITPIILGFLSYLNVKKAKFVFYLLELILFVMFLAFTPMDVFIIFVLVSLTSILISYYAGEDFIWYEVLKK